VALAGKGKVTLTARKGRKRNNYLKVRNGRARIIRRQGSAAQSK
jgi:hypothetical protein